MDREPKLVFLDAHGDEIPDDSERAWQRGYAIAEALGYNQDHADIFAKGYAARATEVG